VIRPANLDHDLFEMPFIVDSRKAMADLIGDLLAEFARPLWLMMIPRG
jgi:hypothetical protein